MKKIPLLARHISGLQVQTWKRGPKNREERFAEWSEYITESRVTGRHYKHQKLNQIQGQILIA